MNIKKQLALAQLDQLEQQDAQRQNAEAMQLLQLMLGAKQNEDASRRADDGLDLEAQRFAEAQRQFGIQTDEARANRQSDIDWRQSRAAVEDTRYADTVDRNESQLWDAQKRDSQKDFESRRRFELEQADKATALKQAAAAQQLAALVQSGAPTEQILAVLRKQNPDMFTDSTAPAKPLPQGGVMTPEVIAEFKAKQEALKDVSYSDPQKFMQPLPKNFVSQYILPLLN